MKFLRYEKDRGLHESGHRLYIDPPTIVRRRYGELRFEGSEIPARRRRYCGGRSSNTSRNMGKRGCSHHRRTKLMANQTLSPMAVMLLYRSPANRARGRRASRSPLRPRLLMRVLREMGGCRGTEQTSHSTSLPCRRFRRGHFSHSRRLKPHLRASGEHRLADSCSNSPFAYATRSNRVAWLE